MAVSPNALAARAQQGGLALDRVAKGVKFPAAKRTD